MYRPLGITPAQTLARDRGVNAAEIQSAAPGMFTGWLLHAAIAGTAGYFVGKQTGSPIGTAAASALFGLPGMFVATLLAPKDGR